MTWFGIPGYLAAMVGLAMFLSLWALTRSIHRWWQHRPLSHRKIRRLQASAEAWMRGSTGTSGVETLPASAATKFHPRRAPELQADAHNVPAWMRDSAGAVAGSESQPAPVSKCQPGAGTRAAHSENASHPLGEPLPGGPGPQHQAGSDSGLVRGSAPSEPQPVPELTAGPGTGPQTPVGDRDPRLQPPTGLNSPSGWRGQGKSGSANPAAGAALATAAPAHTATVRAVDGAAGTSEVTAAPTRGAA